MPKKLKKRVDEAAEPDAKKPKGSSMNAHKSSLWLANATVHLNQSKDAFARFLFAMHGKEGGCHDADKHDAMTDLLADSVHKQVQDSLRELHDDAKKG